MRARCWRLGPGDPNSPLADLLRTSMASEGADEIPRNHITSLAVNTVAATIDAPDARLHAAIAGAMLIGIAS
jgi:hypothetical protein